MTPQPSYGDGGWATGREGYFAWAPDVQLERVTVGERLATHRFEWEARCRFCGGASYPWLTDDATWAKVEPLLGQHQACFECFSAALWILGYGSGEPARVDVSA